MRLGIRELIFGMLMLGMMVCTYLFVFKPDEAKSLVLEKEMAGKKKALADLRQSTVGIKDVELKLTELQSAIEYFESKLPKEKEVDKILEGVTNKAKEHKLQTKIFKTMKIEKSAGYSEQPIQMTLGGDFKGFYAFLLDIERLSRITKVNKMKLDKVMVRDGEMTGELTLSIFFERESASTVAEAR